MSNYLFVYGTLKRSFGHTMHDHLTQHAQYYSDATMRGLMYRVAHYPGVVESDDAAHLVQGELYAITHPQPLFDILDDYEECSFAHPQPHEYVRKLCHVSLPDGRLVQAWVYLYAHDVSFFPLIRSGRFDER